MAKASLIPLSVAALIALTTVSFAQNDSAAPENKGNTGWTGGGRDQPSQGGQSQGTQPQGADTQNAPNTAASPADPNADAAKAQADVDAKAKAEAQAARDDEAAKTQPLMAEGLDLKGEARRFPPRLTAE